MSLKEHNESIYKEFGLDDNEIDAYIVYLGNPQITISEVAGILERDYDELKTITERLEEKHFLKKVSGIVDRYIPLEPYLELFSKRSSEYCSPM